MKYPKAFEKYFLRADRYYGRVDWWQDTLIKKVMYRAWKGGRQYERRTQAKKLKENNARIVYRKPQYVWKDM